MSSAERPQIFMIHIMKTGGLSLSHLLRDIYPDEATYPRLGKNDSVFDKTTIPRLLELDPERRDAIEFYTVHMPAWTAGAAPDHTSLIVLREPVARTVSHLRHIAARTPGFDGLEAVYDDDTYRSRLADYQTQLLAATFEEFRVAHEARAEFRTRHSEGADDIPDPAKWMYPFLTTGIDVPVTVDDAVLDRAVAMLDSFDEVGVTEHLDVLVDRLRSRRGLRLPGIVHKNRSSSTDTPSDRLLARIAEDTRHDAVLYERALARATAGVMPRSG